MTYRVYLIPMLSFGSAASRALPPLLSLVLHTCARPHHDAVGDRVGQQRLHRLAVEGEIGKAIVLPVFGGPDGVMKNLVTIQP